MRKAALALCTLALAAALFVGVRQARDDSVGDQPRPLTRAEVSKPIPGAPPELAALRRRVNVLQGGGRRAFDAQLRALRGYPVVVNMWASWCGPCRIELPHFQREALRRGARVAFLGVNVADNADDARKLAERYPMPYPSFTDPRYNIVAGRFGSRVLPVTVFVDAAGRHTVRQGQFATQADLAAAIERYAL
jgi:cytochrome c biogenesis protein CcmG/thiol:disulfide interchange protein DsbE